MHTMNVMSARKNAFLVIPEAVAQVSRLAQNERDLDLDLTGAKITWLDCFRPSSANAGSANGNSDGSTAHALVCLKSGTLVHLRIRTDAALLRQASASGLAQAPSSKKVFKFEVLGQASAPSCLSSLGGEAIFLGSQLGPSVLLRSAAVAVGDKISGNVGHSSPGGGAIEGEEGDLGLMEDEGREVEEGEGGRHGAQGAGQGEAMDEDALLERELFESSAAAIALDHLRVTICDRLSSLGPIQDTAAVSVDPNHKDELAIAAAVGYGKHAGIALLSQNLKYEKVRLPHTHTHTHASPMESNPIDRREAREEWSRVAHCAILSLSYSLSLILSLSLSVLIWVFDDLF